MSFEHVAAVVLHPHPSMGGDSSHPFVIKVAKRLSERGATVATPDLRDPDVATAAQTLTQLADALDGDRVVLVGYSWGSVVTSHATPANLVARVLVAAPASIGIGDNATRTPTLILVPEHDQYGGLAATQAMVRGDDAVTVEVIDGADHFLWGSIDAIAQRAVTWLEEQL